MKNFNLLISTSRYNEENAKAEIWFTLLICGDQFSISSSLDFQGLIATLTTLNHRKVISKIKDILTTDSNFFQYILKIIPIDYICDTNLNIIKMIIQNHYREYIELHDSFRIKLNRRKSQIIDRDNFINNVAKNIENRVNLENPDKIIRIEVLGNITGISFLKPNDIINMKTR